MTPTVAIAHDYLTQRGGAERVVLAMARAFPDAPIHTTLYDPDGTFPEFAGLDVRTSPLNRVGALRRNHRAALPVLAPAASAITISADLVLASSSGWAHGFRTDGAKVVYCHSPARWLYRPVEYLGEGSGPAKRAAVHLLGPPLRRWDQRAARTADRYLANSRAIAALVQQTYGVPAQLLIPPPGLTPDGTILPVPALADWAEQGFHLVVSRLMPYKHVDQVLRAFATMPDRRLVVVGRGPEQARLEAVAPPNARLLQGLDDGHLRWLYAHATALVAPSLEDLGLTPLEIAGFGRPVLALRAGGYLDTVVEGTTGLFFEAPTASQVAAAVEQGAAVDWDAASDPGPCRPVRRGAVRRPPARGGRADPGALSPGQRPCASRSSRYWP